MKNSAGSHLNNMLKNNTQSTQNKAKSVER